MKSWFVYLVGENRIGLFANSMEEAEKNLKDEFGEVQLELLSTNKKTILKSREGCLLWECNGKRCNIKDRPVCIFDMENVDNHTCCCHLTADKEFASHFKYVRIFDNEYTEHDAVI